MRLTPAGTALLPRADSVLDGADQLHRHARDLASGRVGSLTIACVPPHLERFLAQVIAGFRDAHPDVRVRLREVGTAYDAYDARGSGTVDLATSTPRESSLEGVRLYGVRVVAVPPPQSDLARRREISISSLRDPRLVVAPLSDDALGSEEHAVALAADSPLGSEVWLYRRPESSLAIEAFVAEATRRAEELPALPPGSIGSLSGNSPSPRR